MKRFFSKFQILNSNFQRGVTLLELVISIGMFVIILLSVSQIFQMVINSQRLAVASQDMQESVRYTFDKMSKEIRTAVRDELGSCAAAGKIYTLGGGDQEIFFINYHGRCVHYFLSGGRLMRQENSEPAQYMTPSNLNISSAKYRVDNDDPDLQSRVFMNFDMAAEIQGGQTKSMLVETAVSSRYYE